MPSWRVLQQRLSEIVKVVIDAAAGNLHFERERHFGSTRVIMSVDQLICGVPLL